MAKSKAKRATKTSTAARKKLRETAEDLISAGTPYDLQVAFDIALEQDFKDLVVLLEMSKALNIAPHDLDVKASKYMKQAHEVTSGRMEWVVVPDEDVAREIALERVTEDLKHEPAIFNRAFIEQHINMEKLKKYVYDSRMEDDYVDELVKYQLDDFWRLATQFDVDAAVPDKDEDGNLMEPSRKQIQAVKEAYAEDAAENPLEFFRDIYGGEAIKYAIDAVGIDIEAAAEAAIDADGWAHFLLSYDGNSHETDTGLVYWRTN